MVPLQLELEGFMCYKDVQKFDFSGASLWMLCGANGAGKSSVFDAIRWVLFGQNRAGAQGNNALIHFGQKSARVVLCAEIGGQTVRLTKTTSEKRPTWQIERLENEVWKPIPETGTNAGYRNWIEKNLGFSDETFRATIYLAQGKADQLLEADDEKRTNILKQIVDLSPYERLHKAVVERAHEAQATKKIALTNWQNTSEIAPEALELTRENLGHSRAACNGLRVKIGEMEKLLPMSQWWETLEKSRQEITMSWESARQALVERERIEADFARWQWLQSILPPLVNAVRLQREISELERKSADALALWHSEIARWETAQRDFQNAESTKHSAEIYLNQARAEQTTIANARTQLAGALEAVSRCQELEKLARETALKLEQWPVYGQESLRAARENVEAASKAKTRLPHARMLRQSLQNRAGADREIARLQSEIRHWQNESARLENDLQAQATIASRWQNEENALQAQFLEEQARHGQAGEALERFELLQDATNCVFCGHKLTVQHLQSERARLSGELESARIALQKSQQIFLGAQKKHKIAQLEMDETEVALGQVKTAVEAAHLELRLQTQTLETAQAGVQSALHNLEIEAPEPIWEDLVASEFSEIVLENWRVLSARLTEFGEELKDWELRAQNAALWRHDAENLARELETTRSRIGGDLNEIQREGNSLRSQWEKLQREISEGEVALENAQKRAFDFRNARDTLGNLVQNLENRVRELEAPVQLKRGALLQLLDSFSADLREIWRRETDIEARLHQWEWEKKRLQESGVEEKKTVLDQETARAFDLEKSLLSIKRQIEEVEPQARTPQNVLLEGIAHLSAQAEELAIEEKRSARELESLEAAVAAKKALGLFLAQAEKEDRQWTILRDLLGRDGLQRSLLAEAESGIIEAANDTLSRLSAGALSLQLLDENTLARGINRSTGALNFAVLQEDKDGASHTILAPFLSGSQRFRVAVALAIGMGKFALKNSNTRVETVIIDEGFGSLDRMGREEMRDELQALGNELRRVILVSHQEDFADNFPNRYLISRDGLESHAQLQSV